VNRSGRHKDNAQQHEGGWAEEEPRQEEAAQADADFEVLSREVEEANERLRRAGKAVRLRLTGGQTGPSIEIILPDEAGAAVVTRRIAPGEIGAWVARLESAEGLMIDEKL